ncbi:MAG: flagellin [Phycisphaerae bacterium]
MSRINTNIQSLLATRVLNKNTRSLNESLQRLSTGLRINSGKDDPAGLIASEGLRASKVAITAAIDNANRANNVIGIAEAGLDEVNRLLLELEDLVDRSANKAGLSAAELDANQLQIDAILSSINRIAGTTEFAGTKLLNGGFDFTLSTNTVTGQRLSAIQINSAKIPEGASRSVTVTVQAASEFAFISGAGPATGGATSGVLTLQVQGNFGTEVLSFASGTTLTQMQTAVNASTQLTGVSAAVSGSNIVFTSSSFGSDAMVSVQALNGTFTTNKSNDTGVDGTVIVNGAQANVRGLEVNTNSGSLSAKFTMATAFARMLPSSGTTATFEVTGGGAVFAISPTVGLVGQESIGLASVSTGSLGNGVTGFLSSLGSGQTNDLSAGNFASAQRIIRQASSDVSSLRGRIGAFQKDTLNTTVNALQIAFENTAAAESAIRDADFAVETSSLTRAQILVQASTATLQLANASPQNVLSLLG